MYPSRNVDLYQDKSVAPYRDRNARLSPGRAAGMYPRRNVRRFAHHSYGARSATTDASYTVNSDIITANLVGLQLGDSTWIEWNM